MLLIAGLLLFITFLAVEWCFVKFPVLPSMSIPALIVGCISDQVTVRLFKYSRSTNTLLAMNTIIGWIFWGNLLYIPLYFQNVQGYSPSAAASLILPMVIAHGMTSGLSGIVVSKSGHYMPVIIGGAALWVSGTAVKCWYGQSTPVWTYSIGGILEGIGVGCSLQPSILAPPPSFGRLSNSWP